jgi:predicted metalloendopeptidase
MFRGLHAFVSRIQLPLIAGGALTFTALGLAAAPESHGIDVAWIDHVVAPGDNFFQYANGSWLAATQIPADRSTWGASEEIAELTDKRTADLIREAAASAAPGSEARKIGDYYASFLDQTRIEALGTKPLEPGLQRINAIRGRADLALVLGTALRADVDVLNATSVDTDNLFGLWVAQDLDDPSRYAAFLLQGGLTMPDRDYYLNRSPKMVEIRAQYQTHIARVLTLMQLPDAMARAKRIYALEERMAQAHVSREQTEDVLKGDNHWAAGEFAQRAPGLDWNGYFGAAGLRQQQRFVVWQPGALIGLSALTASEPLDTWKDYLRFHLVERNSQLLPKAFVEEHFAFHGRVLMDTPQQRPRWKLAVAATNDALGEAVGKLYVQRYFPPAEKARAEAMVRNLLRAFAARLDRLTWMTPATRAKAKEKLATLKVGVGYPDKWRDYSGLLVVRGDAFGNAERAELFEYQRNLAKFGKSVDRSEWVMNPQLVNAVNLPAMNALNFPAAILQPPFFDPNRDVVMDYGATGATIGHEISHSFDDQGALFDASGRLKNWWTKDDFAHFQAAGKRLIEQFNAYRPFPDISVNGKQTLSENIADVAGLSVAYDAWRLTLQGKPAPQAAPLSAQQLFFLAFAQSWCEKEREAALRNHIIVDAHAPAEYRADTVRNLDAWYAAFSVKPGQKLYLTPADRVRVW